MFDHMSRYYGLPTASLTLSDGRDVSYVRRRFLPQGAKAPSLADVPVVPGDRLDLLANRIYGDPLAFWRLCDGNDAIDPLEMLRDAARDPNARLRVLTP
jgi:hypothetical protein